MFHRIDLPNVGTRASTRAGRGQSLRNSILFSGGQKVTMTFSRLTQYQSGAT
jgi:hypothetical protein